MEDNHKLTLYVTYYLSSFTNQSAETIPNYDFLSTQQLIDKLQPMPKETPLPANKIFFDGFTTKKQTEYGLKLSGSADKIIEEIRANQSSSGYITLEVKERPAPDKYGNTHVFFINKWEPKKDEKAI